MDRFVTVWGILVLFGAMVLRADNTGTGPNLLPGDFEKGTRTYNPWGGVDNLGNLHVLSGGQFAVDELGRVTRTAFSPSVALGDLNGDGLPDLVVADARGFFWFFPNSGKPNAPAFTHGEIMPIWLGGWRNDGDVVPRIQLIDYAGEGKLDIVAGNYAGQLYFLHNSGSATQPDFRMPSDRSVLEIPTHRENRLWCNFLAPFLFDWSGTGRLDLIMGDGSYSANSIYLFTNQSRNDSPIFNEDHMVKLIPGLGREHLTPQVVDWNNDGKPDIICGERLGSIDLYLNQAVSKSDPPVFDGTAPQKVMFGATDKIGAFTTVCVADLNHDNLFDLAVSDTDGRILYALNTGTPGYPKFGTPVPLKGVYPYQTVYKPRTWSIDDYAPHGAPYELLECTNAQVEPGFAPPPDFKGMSALKFSIVDPHNLYFKNEYFPAYDEHDPHGNKRTIRYGAVHLNTDARYILSFWVRSTGNISNLTWHVTGWQYIAKTDSSARIDLAGSSYSTGDQWDKVSQDVSIPSRSDETNQPVTCDFALEWDGDGTLYFDDFSLKQGN